MQAHPPQPAVGMHPVGNPPPQVHFDPNCAKCHGAGKVTKGEKTKHCKQCYKTAGLCNKCFGTGVKPGKNKPCKCKQEGGKKKKEKKPKQK